MKPRIANRVFRSGPGLAVTDWCIAMCGFVCLNGCQFGFIGKGERKKRKKENNRKREKNKEKRENKLEKTILFD